MSCHEQEEALAILTRQMEEALVRVRIDSLLLITLIAVSRGTTVEEVERGATQRMKRLRNEQ